MGGGGGGKSKEKKIPQEIINKKYIFLRILAKKINGQGGSVQVRLLEIKYEVNDKSRLETKRDINFLYQHDSWVNIVGLPWLIQ